MTKKIFWSNPYQTVHETVVTSVNGPEVTLESTIFFAFSGGQESDHGKIGGFRLSQPGRTVLRLYTPFKALNAYTAEQKDEAIKEFGSGT